MSLCHNKLFNNTKRFFLPFSGPPGKLDQKSKAVLLLKYFEIRDIELQKLFSLNFWF